MKLIYNYFSMNQVLQLARFFLLPLVLLTLISFSGAVSFVPAQTTAEVCRETKKLMEQYGREKFETEENQRFKINEENMRQNLSVLQRAIDNGRLLKPETLKGLRSNLNLTTRTSFELLTDEEKASFQREARSLMLRKLQELSNISLEELDQLLERINQQLDLRTNRYNTYNCYEVLEREEQNKGDYPSLAGAWKGSNGYEYEFTQTGKTFSWRLTNKPELKETATGEFIEKNKIEATWTNTRGSASGEADVETDSNGRATKLTGNNGVTLTRKQ